MTPKPRRDIIPETTEGPKHGDFIWPAVQFTFAMLFIGALSMLLYLVTKEKDDETSK